MPRLEHAELVRIRRRHAGYRDLLVMEIVMLALQPLARLWPVLNPLFGIGLSVLMLSSLTRFSMLRSTRMRAIVLGLTSIVLEVIWLAMAIAGVASPLWFNVLHLVVWLVYLGLTILRMVINLIHEPFVTIAVVMGAASGYLLIGYSGGMLLFTLWLLDPASFTLLVGAPAAGSASFTQLAASPTLSLGAFGYLTSAGTTLVATRSLVAGAATTLITVAGQLYVAILIALVLARYHRRRG